MRKLFVFNRFAEPDRAEASSGPLRLDHNSGVAERGSYAASQAGYAGEGEADEKGACLLSDRTIHTMPYKLAFDSHDP